jgi:hypothetical protein
MVVEPALSATNFALAVSDPDSPALLMPDCTVTPPDSIAATATLPVAAMVASPPLAAAPAATFKLLEGPMDTDPVFSFSIPDVPKDDAPERISMSPDVAPVSVEI